jgi:exosortase F-associated protein
MNKSLLFRITALVLAVFFLVSVRLMEKHWFPEPFIEFFGSDNYLTANPPGLTFKDYFNILFRYAVNSVVSVLILYLLFQDKSLVRFAVKIYVYSGGILFVLFLVSVWIYEPGSYRFLFYVRRLLIHPVLLFILIPAIYFIEATGKTKN